MQGERTPVHTQRHILPDTAQRDGLRSDLKGSFNLLDRAGDSKGATSRLDLGSKFYLCTSGKEEKNRNKTKQKSKTQSPGQMLPCAGFVQCFYFSPPCSTRSSWISHCKQAADSQPTSWQT